MTHALNIADRLRTSASKWPHRQAVVFPHGKDRYGRVRYTHLTFRQLDEESDLLAKGLIHRGLSPGDRLVLMVKPGLEFIALTFAVFKAGGIVVLIDPGMGRKNIFRCLAEVDPHGFLALPVVHAIRIFPGSSFPNAKINIAVNGFFPGIADYHALKSVVSRDIQLPEMKSNDSAAIIFTSGSTGPPKGVLYEHGMFDAQVDLLQQHYEIQPGEIDLPGFPLFALFNSAMGVTTVIPDMNPTKPAEVNPINIITAINDFGITQAFGSPAFWNRVARYCNENKVTFPTLNRALSAGAPVPTHVAERMSHVLIKAETELHTPYGATEALPICSISSTEVLNSTAAQTAEGAGTCVGKPFRGVDVRIIDAIDGSIPGIDTVTFLEPNQIGEIIVKSPSVTREYYNRPEATTAAKIPDGDTFWHRMGDVGYLDDSGRIWFCGRKAHIVHTDDGPMYSVRCEAIFNNHKNVYRSALVGLGEKGKQTPVIIVEPEEGAFPMNEVEKKSFSDELKQLSQTSELTRSIDHFLFHKSFPVDRRHNVKIHREELAEWAKSRLR